MHFRASLQQWSEGRRLRKGFPHNGRCPEIQGGNRQTAPGFSPRRLWGNFSTLRNKAAWSIWQEPRPTPKLAACAPLREPGLASCRRSPPSPHPRSTTTSPPPRRYLSLRGTRRARPRLRRARAVHAGSLANQHRARGTAAPRRAAREPKPGRLLPWRAEPDRAEPSQAEPGAQSAGGGGAEPR